jgi:hypothetical protein
MKTIRVNKKELWSEGLVAFMEIILNVENISTVGGVEEIIKKLKLSKYFIMKEMK